MRTPPLTLARAAPGGLLARCLPLGLALGLAPALAAGPGGPPVLVAPAAADVTLPPGCAPSGSDVVCTFGAGDPAPRWTVPPGVSSATMTVAGAQGGGARGGPGSIVTVDVAGLVAGDVYDITVGRRGGPAQLDPIEGYQGGGATMIAPDGQGLDASLVVAGGGGGQGGEVSSENTCALVGGGSNVMVCYGPGGAGGAGAPAGTIPVLSAAGSRGPAGASVAPRAEAGASDAGPVDSDGSQGASASDLPLGGDGANGASGGSGGAGGGAGAGGNGGHSGFYLGSGGNDPGVGSPGTAGSGGNGGVVSDVGSVASGGQGGSGWFGGGGGGSGQTTSEPCQDYDRCNFIAGAGGGGGGSDHVLVPPPGSALTLVRTDDGTAQRHGDGSATITYPAPDTTGPTVTVAQAAGQADPTGTPSAGFTVTFSEPVTGFSADDLVVGGTASASATATVTGSGGTYAVDVAGLTRSGTVSVLVPVGAAQDATGNPSAASSSTDDTVTYDGDAPDVAVTAGPGQPDPTNHSPLAFTARFSEPVTGFSAADVGVNSAVTGASVTAVSQPDPGVPEQWQVLVALPADSPDGTVGIAIPAGAVTDEAGNPNRSSTGDAVVAYDATRPTVSSISAEDAPGPTASDPVRFAVTFDESVTGFASGDDVLVGGTAPGAKVASVSGSGRSYVVAVSTVTGPGTVTVRVPESVAVDRAGNPNRASELFGGITYQPLVGPGVVVSQDDGQADPTSATPVEFAVLFDAGVTGFTAEDVQLGGTAPGARVSAVRMFRDNPASYVVEVAGMTGDGTVSVTVPAGAAVDTGGLPSSASTSSDNIVTYRRPVTPPPPPPPADLTPPSVMVLQAPDQADPTEHPEARFLVAFSEPVTGFSAADVDLTGSASRGAGVDVMPIGDGASYQVTVRRLRDPGTVTLAVPAGAATDPAGNPSTASTSPDDTVTYRRPDVRPPDTTITDGPGQNGIALSRTVELAYAADEPDAGFVCTLDDEPLTCPGPAVTLAGLASGRHVFTVAAVDPAGNLDRTPAMRAWTVPLGPDAFSRHGWWRRPAKTSVLDGSYLRSDHPGDRLGLRLTDARRVYLLALTGPRQGRLTARLGGVRIDTVDLAGSEPNVVRLLAVDLPEGLRATGRLTLTVRGHAPVRVVGVAALEAQ